MNNNKMVIGVYMRVSTGKQVDYGFSLEAQKVEGTQFAHKMFGENAVIEYYVDEGISAKSTQGRMT